MRVAVIGAGAAGCFAAINIKRLRSDADVHIYEAGSRPLAKVAITGGGRCNLTNSFAEVGSMEGVYPRGTRLMTRILKEFGHAEVMEWFENEGVRLVVQDDQCVFPRSQDAMEIVNCLLEALKSSGVKIFTGHRAESLTHDGDKYHIAFRTSNENHTEVDADIVLVTVGGASRKSSLDFLGNLELEMIQTVPSLFSLNLDDKAVRQLAGAVVTDATAILVGTKFKASGPLLITDWGMSGPAILKLSSYAAVWLSEHGYKAELSVNWYGQCNENEVRGDLMTIMSDNTRKLIGNAHPSRLTRRHWLYLLDKLGIPSDSTWGGLGNKNFNRLVSCLTNDIYWISGKNRFKDEFVTCGGVALSNIVPSTLECRKYPGLYFAGEILDVDAITGGFNLQAAWTMGYIAAKSIATIL